MKNKFLERSIIQKIIIALIFLTVFNFVYPYIPAYGADALESVGGVLLEPLIKLITTICEGVIWVVQSMILGLPASNIHIEKEGSTAFWVGLAAGAAVVVGAVLSPFTFGASAVIAAGAVTAVAVGVITSKMLPDDWYYPVYKISPQEIFSDQVPALHINFINPKTYSEESKYDETSTTDRVDGAAPVFNSAKVLAPQISKWYVAIRNMVLVGLMVVLLYIGIRIVISSTAGEKAKYKEHIKDWLIAVILVVFMHYIMAFALTITEYITSMLNSNNEMIKFQIDDEDAMKQIFGDEDYSQYKNSDGTYDLYVNLMGYARLQQQLETRDENGNVTVNWNYIGYAVIYLTLVIYTIMFLIIYLKRVIYMAFLTMIAPLVALTYPIDKIGDGKAQAFDMWLKEYAYNLLLQPFHLLLYTMLIGSVMDLAVNNMIYALVALGFLIPGEKLFRRFFGFEKAATTGSIVGGVVGGSLAMNAINKLGKIGPGGSKGGKAGGKGSGSGDSGSDSDSTKIRTADKGTLGNDELYAQGFGGSEASNSSINSNAGSGSGIPRMVNAGSNNIPFDADSRMEGIPDVRGWMNNGKEALINSKPISAIRGIGEGINNWAQKTPKTAKGRNTKRLVIRGAKSLRAAGGTAARYTGKALAGVGRRAPRLIAKATTGAALGMAGVAAGLASGNLENAFTYGAAAAGIGANLGDKATTMADNATNAIASGAKQVGNDYMSRRYTKDELEKKENEKIDRAWKNDKEVVKAYKDKFGKDGYKEAMNNALEYRKQGVTDDKAIMAAQKLDGLGDNKASAERIALAKAATTIKSEEDLNTYHKRLRELGIPTSKIKEVKSNIRKMNKM
jgi:membrane protein